MMMTSSPPPDAPPLPPPAADHTPPPARIEAEPASPFRGMFHKEIRVIDAPVQKAFLIPSLWLGVFLVNLAAAAVMVLLSRRYFLSRSASAGWVVAALVVGLWTLVFFAGSHHLPGVFTCPQCRRARPGYSDECPFCKAAYPAPARNGTEIFA